MKVAGNSGIASSRRGRRSAAAGIAAVLTVVLAVDPFGLGQVAPALADGPGSDLLSRTERVAEVVDGLDLEQPREASELTGSWDPLPGLAGFEELPAELPEEDEQVVVLTEEGGVAAAALGAQSSGGGGSAGTTLGGMDVEVAATDSQPAPAAVRLRVAGEAEAAAAGVTGVLLEVSDASTSPAAADAEVLLTVSYEDFAGLVGGDWASRLRLVWIPECEEGEPGDDCRPVPLATVNDPEAQTVRATVPVAPQEVVETSLASLSGAESAGSAGSSALRAAAGGGAGRLAVTAGASGEAGDWSATSLNPSATWGAGGSTGAFSWSMPIPVPAAPAGPSPELGLSYSSAGSDGRTPATNNQSGSLGEGFDLTTGYIERSYVPCMQDESGAANNADRESRDLCWGTENATLMFQGAASELIRDEDTGTWHSKNDDGTRVERLTGAWNGGERDEYWKVTTTDGIQYFFGRGKRSSSDTASLNSAWTVPVYGNHPSDPCYRSSSNGGFADSRCTQVWRWNLEYVVDPSGNSMTYFYEKETNRYVYDLMGNTSGESVSYVAGGRLARIEYGTRAGSENSGPAPARVSFTTTPRCVTDLSDPSSFCNSSQTSTSQNHWPDVPTDLVCEASAGCLNISPVFFDRYRLSEITTAAYDGTSYRPVDSWRLEHVLSPQGTGIGIEHATGVMLVLTSVTHTGHGGTSSTSDDITLPPNRFGYTFLANRADADSGHTPLWRPRVTNVITESGASVNVNYRTECAPGDMPGTSESAQENNTRLCYPVKWFPNDDGVELVDYFHKYVVASIIEVGAPPVDDEIEGELVTGSRSVYTTFTYSGGAAWEKPTGAMVKPREVTFSDFRGFAEVTTTVGEDTEAVSTRTRYFRGTGETLTAGPAGHEVTATDRERYQGQVFASISLNGTAKVSETVTVPGTPVTVATNSKNVKATRVPSSTAYGFSYDADGDLVHRTSAVSTFDANSQVVSIDDRGDLATAADDTCTSIEYAHETNSAFATKHLVGLAAHTEAVAAACGEPVERPADVISSSRVSYDAQGRALRSERIDPVDGDGHVLVSEVLEYDERGRPLRTADAAGQVSTVAYGHSAGGLLQSLTTTTPDPDGAGPLEGFVSTTTFNPVTGTVAKTTDANGRETTGTYDALGRLLTVRYPQHAGSTVPSVAYEYRVRANGLNSVVTKTLGADGATQHVSSTLYDGLLRPFQSQAEGVDAGPGRDADAAARGRMVSHTYYDTAGRVTKQTGQWWAQGAVQSTPIDPVAVPPSATTYEYDAAGRTVAEIFWVGTESNPEYEKWRTVTAYDGATTIQVPPMGGRPQATVVDARGRTIELRQYLRDPDDDPDADTVAEVLALPSQSTTYVYDAAGQRVEMRDAADNVWGYAYDWAGRQVSATDPDAGTSTTTYDVLDRVLTRTNGNGDTLAYTYDPLGRTTTLRDDSPTGPIRAQWEFDQTPDADGDPMLGQPSSSTRFVNGLAYTTSVLGYDEAYRPTGTTVSLPDAPEFEALESTSFTTEYTYTADGQVASLTLPGVTSATGARVLGREIVTTRYDTASVPSWMGGGFGWGTYVPFTLACRVESGADEGEIESVSAQATFPEELKRLWLVSREAWLFEDVRYGQWGLHILNPAESAARTGAEAAGRPDAYRPGDIVVGEFLGDSELLVCAPAEDAARRYLIALPLDPRDDWPAAGASAVEVLQRLHDSGGEKYWETRAG